MELPADNLFAALVTDTALAIIVTRADDGIVVYVNEAYAKARGVGVDDLIGQSVGDLALWPSDEIRQAWVEKIRQEGHAAQRFDFTNPDGSKGASTLFTELTRIDDIDYFTSYNIDITPMVQAEQEREEALARLRRAQEIARIADFTFDHSTQLITGSDQLAKILRWGPGQFSIPIVDVFARHSHPDDHETTRHILLSDPSEFNFTARYMFNDDDYIWIEMVGSVIRNERGEVTQWEGTIQDVTDRKTRELEREEIEDKMRAAQKLESLGLLAGGVAHDFNNLLVGIMGNADFALMEPGISSSQESRIRDIVTASQRAADLTNQLLAYSGKGRFVIQATSLSDLVREMGELLKVSVSRNSMIHFHLDTELPAVNIDQTQIRQVVMNLIINASEAIEHANGLINVTTGVQYCSEDYINQAALGDQIHEGNYVFVEISDNGCGMTREVMSKLFEPFFTTKFSGRGLGMSAVMGIVRGHAGAVKIYSEVDVGTTFKVFIPAAEGQAQSDHEQNRLPEIRGASRGVLVIDDDPIVCDMLSDALTNLGFRVVIGDSGQAGLNAYRENAKEIVLVFLDLTMPGLSGVDTFAALRQQNSMIKVVLMSGYNEQEATQHFVGKGLAGFLQKPFRVADFKKVVHDILEEDASQK